MEPHTSPLCPPPDQTTKRMAFVLSLLLVAFILGSSIDDIDAKVPYAPGHDSYVGASEYPQEGPTANLSVPSEAWRGQYFDTESLTNLKVERIDPVIDFEFGMGSPNASIAPDTFSARWEGDWTFDRDGTYRFTLTTDDGMRVWVDNNKVFDEWTNRGRTTHVVNTSLDAGVHRIKVEWNDMAGEAVAKVSWRLESSSSWLPSWLTKTQALAVVGVGFLVLIALIAHFVVSRRGR